MKLLDRIVLMPFLFFSIYLILCKHMQNGYLALALAAASSAFLYAAILRAGSNGIFLQRKKKKESFLLAQRFVRSLAFWEPETAVSVLSKVLCAEFRLQPVSSDVSFLIARSAEKNASVCIFFVLRHPADGPLTAQETICALRQMRKTKAKVCAIACLCAADRKLPDAEFQDIKILNGDDLAAIFAKNQEYLPESSKEGDKIHSKIHAIISALQHPVDLKHSLCHIFYAFLLVPGWLLSRSAVLLICIVFHLFYALRGIALRRSKSVPSLL